MINITREDLCCGCGACVNICPKNCISLVEKPDGFKYPVVEKSLCIKCGLCNYVCPYTNPCVKSDVLSRPEIYYSRSKDETILNVSSSGGIFAELAKYVLNNNGYVYGAVFGEKYDEVYHTCISSMAELERLQGSKYVQSDIGTCYSEAKKLLNNGELVLFSGTPCHIAGLLSFLGDVTYDNLLTCDLICHGVPSPVALRSFVKEKEKETGKKVIKYYRNKKYGWKPAAFDIVYGDGTTERVDGDVGVFTKMFSEHNLYHRNSCYCCKFARVPRIADITLGDYFVETWAEDENGNRIVPCDNKGQSIVTLNTITGKKYFNMILENIEYIRLKNHTVTSWHLYKGPGTAANPAERQFFFYLHNKGKTLTEIFDIMYGNKNRLMRIYYKILQKICK